MRGGGEGTANANAFTHWQTQTHKHNRQLQTCNIQICVESEADITRGSSRQEREGEKGRKLVVQMEAMPAAVGA